MDALTTLFIAIPAQVAVFLLVPLAWWLGAGRPDGSLWRWLGFRPVDDVANPVVVAAAVTAGLGFLGAALMAGRSIWPLAGQGLVVLAAVVLVAVVQTALTEELFFRGFLLRWLGEHRTGWVAANLIQSLACGLLRLATQWIFVDRSTPSSLAAFALASGSAFLAGTVRQRTGSLLMPWAAHAAGNLLAGVVAVVGR